MKKIIAVLLALTFGMANFAFAEETIENTLLENIIFRLSALDIMRGYDDGTFKLENEITRAEAIAIAVRILGIDNMISAEETNKYLDVDDTHWAKGYINAATALNFVDGYDDGNFYPDQTITNEQTIKLLVSVLNYQDVANQKGGYPAGFVKIATNLGILNNVKANLGAITTRETMAHYIYNLLDTKLLTVMYGAELNYKVEDNGETVLERLLDKKEAILIKGIITHNEFTSLWDENGLLNKQIKIDNTTYKIKDNMIPELIGQYVEVYGVKINNDDIYTIEKYRVVNNKNKIVTLDAIDVEGVSTSKIEYTVKKDKISSYQFDASEFSVIYNGKAILLSNATEDILKIHDGKYNLIDNDADGKYEVLNIIEQENFPVDRISSISKTIYFKNNFKYRGMEAIRLELDDEDYQYSIVDKDNQPIKYIDIKEGDTITVVGSLDQKKVKIIVSNKLLSGVVTELSEDSIGIDGVSFVVAKGADGNNLFNPKLSETGSFYVNTDNKAVYLDKTGNQDMIYAYVVEANKSSSVMPTIYLKLLNNSQSNKKIEIKNDVQNITYRFLNDDLTYLEISDRLLFNGKSCNVSSIDISMLDNQVIRYKINADKKVKSLDTFAVPSARKKYEVNCKILSLGGTSDTNDGYFIGANTKVMCVPLNNVTSDLDYFKEVVITHKSITEAVAINIDSETQIADAVLIYADMDMSRPVQPDSDSAVAIVGKIRKVIDDEGNMIYKVEILKGEELITLTSREEGVTYNKLAGLVSGQEIIRGDLIRYSLDGFGKIDAIDKLASVQGQSDMGDFSNSTYGIANSIKYNRLNSVLNDKVDILELMYVTEEASSVRQFDIVKIDGPKIYLYNRQRGTISPSSTEDILTYQNVGENADKIFMYIQNNQPQVVVIIKD